MNDAACLGDWPDIIKGVTGEKKKKNSYLASLRLNYINIPSLWQAATSPQ